MIRLPLLGHTRPDQIVAWHQGRAITVARFLSDVYELANQLPPRQYLLICAVTAIDLRWDWPPPL